MDPFAKSLRRQKVVNAAVVLIGISAPWFAYLAMWSRSESLSRSAACCYDLPVTEPATSYPASDVVCQGRTTTRYHGGSHVAVDRSSSEICFPIDPSGNAEFQINLEDSAGTYRESPDEIH